MVDDNECERFLVQEILKGAFGANSTGIFFQDGTAFLDYSESSVGPGPDLIILDYRMPPYSGEEVARILAETRPEWLPKTLLISTLFTPGLEKDALKEELGLIGVVERPFSFHEYRNLLIDLVLFQQDALGPSS